MQECSFLIAGSAHGVDVDVIPFCHFATPSGINKNDCRDLDASNFTELNRCENFSTIHFILMSLSDPDGLLAPLLIFSLVSDFQQTFAGQDPKTLGCVPFTTTAHTVTQLVFRTYINARSWFVQRIVSHVHC